MVDPGQAAQAAFPNAKINVGLQVRPRPDGYHALDSLFLPVPWCDTLEISTPGSTNDVTLHLHGHAIAGAPEDNLIVRAYRLLQENHALPPCDVHLIKAIPSGAGLGGGSADGTFALRLLNAHFTLGLDVGQLESLAGKLGSDCPFFVRNEPCRVTGRGEHLSPISLQLEGWHIALIHPGVMGTAEAFGWVTPMTTALDWTSGRAVAPKTGSAIWSTISPARCAPATRKSPAPDPCEKPAPSLPT